MDKKDILVRRNCFEFSAIIILESGISITKARKSGGFPCFHHIQASSAEQRRHRSPLTGRCLVVDKKSIVLQPRVLARSFQKGLSRS